MENIQKFREIEFLKRDIRLKNGKETTLEKSDIIKDKLNIVYVMTWTEICGGSKIILEHCNRLSNRGHIITIISHFPKPNWFDLCESIDFIQVPWEQILCESIPKCDIIVATYWREIYECVEQKIAPVVYFEQGDFHLFDSNNVESNLFNHIKKQFEFANFIYTVSNYAKDKIFEIYNKESYVINNAINDGIFFKKDNDKKNNSNNVSITAIGSYYTKFKGIDKILKAIEILKKENSNINFSWITPDTPEFHIQSTIVNPTQMQIADILRNTDIYVCASEYESFCLPVLEAMCCGAAVITTDNGGVRELVEDNFNALILKNNDVETILEKIRILISDTNLRNRLIENAYEKSKEFSWDNTIDKLENYYKCIASYKIIN